MPTRLIATARTVGGKLSQCASASKPGDPLKPEHVAQSGMLSALDGLLNDGLWSCCELGSLGNAHHCLQPSRVQELKMALSADGLLSVKKSRCTSTSMGSTLLRSACAHSSGEAGCECRAACSLTWAHRIHGLLL